MRKNLIASVASLVLGMVLFSLVVKFAGPQNIISSVKEFSPRYFVPFLAVTLGLFAAATYRWKVVLDGEGAHVSFWVLLKYKIMVFGINYLTPVARLGGEPFKIVLLENQRIKSSKSFASIVLDNFIGMGFDAVLGGLLLIILFFTSSLLPLRIRELLLATGLVSLAVVIASYLLLIKKKGIFSSTLNIAGILTRIKGNKFFVTLQNRVTSAEFYIRNTLMKKPKQVMLVSFYAALSWPLAVLQYKFALLMLGADASVAQIVVIIAVITLTTFVPVPASLGIQEAGQFAVFKILGQNPHLGIALSFVIRLKDFVLLYLSMGLLSLEGFNFLKLLNDKFHRVEDSGQTKKRAIKKAMKK